MVFYVEKIKEILTQMFVKSTKRIAPILFEMAGRGRLLNVFVFFMHMVGELFHGARKKN